MWSVRRQWALGWSTAKPPKTGIAWSVGQQLSSQICLTAFFCDEMIGADAAIHCHTRGDVR